MKATRRLILLASALAVLFSLAPMTLVMGQESRATVVGRVTDSNGAVVPGAEVKLTNVATGVTISAQTNEDGNYRIPYLVPGMYRVTVNKDQFGQYVREGLELRVADTVTIDVALQVGAVNENVLVTADAPVLDSATAALGQVVDARRLAELPVRDGSPLELVALAPGVVNTTDLRLRKAPFNNGLSQFSTDGAGQYNNEFSIDGVPNTANNRVAYSPPTSAVQEFKIQTTTYDASLGHTMGSVVNVVTTSGTNELHGEAHEWLRNAALDANNFFDNRAGNKKKVYQDNRYGFSLGGPIYLPKLYNGQNRSFWFFAFEANPFKSPQSTIRTVPTLKMRQGDFSDLLKIGAQYQIYDPATIRADGSRFRRDPLQCNGVLNVICPNRIDPIAKKILEFYPLPNQPGTADGRNNYAVPNAVALETYRTYTGRFDHNFSDRHRMYFRFSLDFWEEEKNDWYNNISNGIFLNRLNRIGAIDDVYTFSPTLLLNVRFGYTRQLFPERRRSKGYDLASLGFSPALVGLIPKENATFPRIVFDNYGGFGEVESGDGHFNTDIYSFSTSLTWLRGSHSFRFGPDYRVYRENGGRFANDYAPQINFNTSWTRGPLDNSPTAPIGQDFASFLLGYVGGGNMTRTSAYSEQSTWVAFHLHDDWKVNNKLTLNLGLRYELDNPLTERFDRMVNGFDFAGALPIEAQVLANYAKNPIAQVPVSQFAARGGLLFAGVNGRDRGLWKRDNRNLMPRFGLAYQLDAKTVVRGGYGIFFDTLGTNRATTVQSGYSRTTSIVPSLDNGRTFVATFANPFPNGLLAPFGNTLGLMTDVGGSVNFGYLNPRNPYAQRWSLGLQRELPGKFVVEASYVGNRGVALPISREFNAVPAQYLSTLPTRDTATNNLLTQAVPNPFFPLLPGTSLAGSTVQRQQLLRPFPQFTSVQATITAGDSWYHSLQTRFERRMANGITLQGSYTWAKGIEATGYLNATDVAPEEVISAFDRTHTFSGSGIYELPFGRGRKWGNNWNGLVNHLFGGWQANVILKMQSGAALGFGNSILIGDITDAILPKSQRTVDRWFNQDAFVRASSQQLVSNIRTMPSRFSALRGPGYIVWDISGLKNIQLTERFKLQFRAEAYNAFNRPNFRDPNTSVTSSSFGQITAQNGLPRQFQLALKVSF